MITGIYKDLSNLGETEYRRLYRLFRRGELEGEELDKMMTLIPTVEFVYYINNHREYRFKFEEVLTRGLYRREVEFLGRR